MKFTLTRLDWDSNFFGMEVGKLNIDDINEISTLENNNRFKEFDLIYIFSPSAITSNNIDGELKLVDVKCTFITEIIPLGYDFDVSNCNSYIQEVVNDQLYSLAIQSGKYSRFKDKRFLPNTFDRFYRRWIENSVNRLIADEVFVYETKQGVLGFLTIRKKGEVGVIGLIAVDEQSRGQSIGSKLIACAKSFCVKHRLKTLEVATQRENAVACSFYQKNGFSESRMDYIYHLWI